MDVEDWSLTRMGPNPYRFFKEQKALCNYTPLKTNKINGWKMTFTFDMVPFWEHVNFFGGVHAL